MFQIVRTRNESLSVFEAPFLKLLIAKQLEAMFLPKKTFTFLYKPEASNFWAIYPVDELPRNFLGLDDLLIATEGGYPASA